MDKSLEKSLGPAAFGLLMVSFFVPKVGNYLSLLAVLILCIAAYKGDKTWTLVADPIAWVKMFFLSPSWQANMFFGNPVYRAPRNILSYGSVGSMLDDMTAPAARPMNAGNVFTIIVTVAILAAPIVIMLWRANAGKAAIATPSDRKESGDA